MATALAIGGSAVLSGLSSLFGSSNSASASKTASWDQTLASLLSIQTYQNLYNQGASYQAPFATGGYGAETQVTNELANPNSQLFSPYNPSTNANVAPGSPQSPV